MQRTTDSSKIIEIHKRLFQQRIEMDIAQGDPTPLFMFAYDSKGDLLTHGLIDLSRGDPIALYSGFGLAVHDRVVELNKSIKITGFLIEALTYIRAPNASFEFATLLYLDTLTEQMQWRMARTGRNKDGKGDLRLDPWEGGCGNHPLGMALVCCNEAFRRPELARSFVDSKGVTASTPEELLDQQNKGQQPRDNPPGV